MFPNLKMSLAPLVLRLSLAGIFLYHGYLKVSSEGSATWNTVLPPWLQMTVAWGEVIGGGLLVVGLLSRLAAVWFVATQIGAILTITGDLDFVHPRGTVGQAVEAGAYRWQVGYEYNFALIAMCLTLLLLGSGCWSIDYLLFHSRKSSSAGAAPLPPVPESALPASPAHGGAGSHG